MRTSLGPSDAAAQSCCLRDTEERSEGKQVHRNSRLSHVNAAARHKKHTEVIIMLSGRRLFKGDTLWCLMDMLTWLVDVKYFGMPKVKN